MNAMPTAPLDDDNMPSEIDFSAGVRGKFFHADSKLNLPVYLEADVHAFLTELALKKGVEISTIVNDLLKKDMALLDVLR